MSFKVFFDLSTGIAGPINVPIGTTKMMLDHVALLESALGIEREEYNGQTRWNRWPLIKKAAQIKDELLCSTVDEHNAKVRYFYGVLEEAGPATDKTEELTPEKAQEFWLGLSQLEVPVARWSNDFYRARMEAIYECLRGRESEGMLIDCEPLSPKQADEVINLFSQWLDRGDIRLAVKKDCDYLSSSYDGEYEWCAGCGAVDADEIDFDDEANCFADYCFECQSKRVEASAATTEPKEKL